MVFETQGVMISTLVRVRPNQIEEGDDEEGVTYDVDAEDSQFRRC